MRFIAFNQDFYSLIEGAFKQFIEPLYADQSAALKKIVDAVDRKCEILFVNDQPVGFIVYKTSLQSEFGLESAFELKTLLLFDALANVGLGKTLFRRAEALARGCHAKYIYATVSENLSGLVKYMEKDGWYVLKHKQSDDNHVDVVVMVKELHK